MNRFLSTTASSMLAVAFSTTVALADGPTPPPVMPPVVVAPSVDWTGPYGGIVLSFNNGTFGNDGIFPGDGEGDVSGNAAGLVLGYDFQRGNWVFGGELNIQKANIEGDDLCANPVFDCGVEVDKVGSLRARVGYTIAPQTLIYGTAGVAAADIYAYTDGPIGENGETKRVSGAVFGLGFEQMVNSRFSIRGAVLRHQFNDTDFLTDIPYSDIGVDFTTIEFGGVMRF